MKFNSLTITTICATVAIAGLIQTAAGHNGATGIVKERMDGMVVMGKALGAIADMFKGKRDFDAKTVAQSGDTLIKHAKTLGDLFPDTKASRPGKHSAALSVVWEKNDAFLALAKSLGEKAEGLKLAADSGDQQKVKMAFGQTAKVCSACHEGFRKPKE